MNPESNSTIRRTQTGKPDTSKRAHRANRNRPVLVTGQDSARVDAPTQQTIEEVRQAAAQTAVEEKSSAAEEPARKRGPRFFLNIGGAEKRSDKPGADPKAARMARAMRGNTASTSTDEPVKEKKSAASASKAGSIPTRPPSRFKTRYLWGIMIYVLVAEVSGGYITNFMIANRLEGPVFSLGPYPITRSILVFLAFLVIVLVAMTRFDLIPRSFRAMGGDPTPRGTSPASKTQAPTFSTKAPQPPAMKQGVQGEHDDLYKEYRENQRYFQRRDRKR